MLESSKDNQKLEAMKIIIGVKRLVIAEKPDECVLSYANGVQCSTCAFIVRQKIVGAGELVVNIPNCLL